MPCLYGFNESTVSTAIDKQTALVDSILEGGNGVAEKIRADVQSPWMTCHHDSYGIMSARKEGSHVAWSWFISSLFPETRSSRYIPYLYAFCGSTMPTAIDKKQPALVDFILRGGDDVAEQCNDDEAQLLRIPKAVSASHDGAASDNVFLDETTGYSNDAGW